MSYQIKRVDSNQKMIVKLFRQHGASVQHLHTIGNGCPDICVGFRGVNYLIEIKDGNGGLTDDESDWHADWRGQVCIVRTIDDVIALMKKWA